MACKEIVSRSANETMEIARQMGYGSLPGDIICLVGGLGAGKTVFVQGFCDGLEVTERITSPTFTLVNEYHSGKFPVYHFDAYRLGKPDDIYDTGLLDYVDDGVTLIEWADIVADLLPVGGTVVTIDRDFTNDDDYRKIIIKTVDK